MKMITRFIVCLGLLAPAVVLAEVGKPVEDLKTSSFFTFFHVAEVRRVNAPRGRIVVQWETGGFKEHINLSGVLADTGRVVSASLLVARKWIAAGGTINPFAKDIVKSFMNQFVPRVDRAQAAALSDRIGADTPQGPALPGWDVFIGARRSSRDSYSSSNLEMANVDIRGEPWFVVWVYEKGFELQGAAPAADAPVPASFFLGSGEMTSTGLKLTQDTPKLNLKAWSNLDPKASINRVVDIRWMFATAGEARQYHLTHLGENSEKAREIALGEVSPFGQELRVYQVGAEDPLASALGLKINMYFFLFLEQNVLAKVFVSGSHELTLNDASRIARSAHGVIQRALAAR